MHAKVGHHWPTDAKMYVIIMECHFFLMIVLQAAGVLVGRRLNCFFMGGKHEQSICLASVVFSISALLVADIPLGTVWNVISTLQKIRLTFPCWIIFRKQLI